MIARAINDENVKNPEMLPTYDLPQSIVDDIHHLTPINPNILIENGRSHIDIVHRDARLHVGHVLFVMDGEGYVLFMKRSGDVVTCPNTWSVLGEHANDNEMPNDVAIRGIVEELGLVVVPSHATNVVIPNDDGGTTGIVPGYGKFVVPFAPNYGGIGGRGGSEDDYDDGEITPPPPLLVTFRNATELPLYYIRRYGPRNDNRVDRQLTYMWYATFPLHHDRITWRLDDEVADHVWMKLDDAWGWLSNDAYRDGGDDATYAAATNSDGEPEWRGRETEYYDADDDEDDGPDRGDFCHGTIRSLYLVGLENILRKANH
jgi:hypothetical protein